MSADRITFFARLGEILRTTDQRDHIEVARALAELGVPVVATVPGLKQPLLTREHIHGVDKEGEVVGDPCQGCNSAGLRPAALQGATTDRQLLNRVYEVHPTAGVGMGPHPWVVRVDADCESGDDLKKVMSRLGYGQPHGEPLPCEAATPGGPHRRRWIHELPEGVPPPGAGTSWAGVAWYGEGGQAVIKGTHPTKGTPYPRFHGEITPLPKAAADWLGGRANSNPGHIGGGGEASSAEVQAFLDRYTAGERTGDLDRLRNQMGKAQVGDRHHLACGLLCGGLREAIAGWFPAAEVVQAIREGLVAAQWDPARFAGEFTSMIRWAVGQVQHLTPEEAAALIDQRERDRLDPFHLGNGGSSVPVGEDRPTVEVEADHQGPDGHRYTDSGNALRLVERHGSKIRFVAKWGKWLVYDRGRWVLDDANVFVHSLAKGIANEMLTGPNLRAIHAIADEKKRNEARKAFFGHIKRTENVHGIEGTARAAAMIPGISIAHDRIDGNPWLLNVLNGTVNLRTGELRPHDPGDLCMMQAPVPFIPWATAPRFTAFMEAMIPDPEVRRFVQQLCGVVLVGEQIEHILPILLGNGFNGKSTFTRILAEVLGDYAVTANKELFLAQRHTGHPTVRAALFRKRFAYTGEIKQGSALDEAGIKELTGGDRITARRMNEDPWEFDPSHTLWVHANHRPHISGTDEGIWRRVVLIPFDVVVPAGERDPELCNTIVQTEGAGVLWWMYQGLRDQQDNKMQIPEIVRVASNRYRRDSDTAGAFISAIGIEVDPVGVVLASDLKAAHEEWYTLSGAVPPGTNEAAHYVAVTQLLKDRGARSVRKRFGGVQATVWEGVALLD
jgi:P4 family phage/plasmid primase-like protien